MSSPSHHSGPEPSTGPLGGAPHPAGHPADEERAAAPPASTFNAIAGIIDSAMRLMRNEAALFRADATRAATSLAGGVAFLAVAAVLGMVGLNVLAGAAMAGLVELGLKPWLSALIVGGVLLLLALAFVQTARQRLQGGKLRPSRSERSLQRDLDTVQAAVASPAGGSQTERSQNDGRG